MASFGYARVSTSGQSLDAQIDLLRDAGCDKIYTEKASGARSDRKQLRRVLRAICKDDILVVTRLDRLARSTVDLLNTVKLVGERGASFKSLAEPWADTTTPAGRFLLTIIGGLAEFERHLIRERTTDGRVRAQRAGVRFGRKPKLTPDQCEQVKLRRAGGQSLRSIAREIGVSANTIARVR